MKKFILSACLTALTAATVFANIPTSEEVRQIFQLPITELTSESKLADLEILQKTLETKKALLSTTMSREAASDKVEKMFAIGYPALYAQYSDYTKHMNALKKLCAQSDGRIKRFIKKSLNVIKRHKAISAVMLTSFLAATVYGAAYLCTTSYPELYQGFVDATKSMDPAQTIIKWRAANDTLQATCIEYAHEILRGYGHAYGYVAGKLGSVANLITSSKHYQDATAWTSKTATPAVKQFASDAYATAVPYVQSGYEYIKPYLRDGCGKIATWLKNASEYVTTIAPQRSWWDLIRGR
ncbi:MAG: hypothetical protein WCW33_02315 [Candidatus Babeliales bacterium]|jgi:hypothetical protein